MDQSDMPISAQHPDDALLIDYHLQQCESADCQAVEKRLAEDAVFARRYQKVRAVFTLLNAHPDEQPPEPLLARTLKAVEGACRTSALLDREAVRSRPLAFPTFSLKELASLAAMLLIVAGILLPSWRQAKQLSTQQACLARVSEIGTALKQYAIGNDGVLPGLGNARVAWMPSPGRNVSSNSQSLWMLVRGGFARPTLFQCPAVGQADLVSAAHMKDFPPERKFISYSYHNSVNTPPLRISGPSEASAAHLAILADRTPVFDDGCFRADRVSAQVSPNHGRRGQAVLYLDMHAVWAKSAEVGVNGDNIWLVQGVSNYDGTERPSSPTDSFMLPAFIPSQP